jgi:hypothetical protein
MLEQILDLVKGLGKKTVVENTEVPNEYNNDVMAEATNTVAGGLRNIMAGGGLDSIISLFQKRGQSGGGGIGNLLKNPIVMMMVGHFISKLVSKYKMNSSSASSVANNLIPNVLSSLIEKTQDPNDENFTLDKLIGSLSGGGEKFLPQQERGFNFQDLVNNFQGEGNGNKGNGFDLQDIISQVTNRTRDNIGSQSSGSGLFDMIKGLIR